ncbi:DUF3867 family protein [Proteiniclasticum sp.]|uniref:DUF3867 family protein n=1 Tax=Proteiniclasticum sp. TaxID=2053595 RepID=UPI002896BD04|nr:DUF3867 family protein [Proteiniclasticum sp.]
MSDVIDFNELKNKVRDKDIDDFESYIFNLYGQMGAGTQDIASINKAIVDYMEKNSISYEKFMEIQTRLMERYGVSMEDIQSQYNLTNNDEYKKYRKQLGFMDKYKGKITDYSGFYYEIRNSVNDLSLFLNKTVVIITSKVKVDLADNELNEFLVSYKKLQDDKKLQIRISENYREYDY